MKAAKIVVFMSCLIVAGVVLTTCGGGGGDGGTPPVSKNVVQTASGTMGFVAYVDENGNKVSKAYVPTGDSISVVTVEKVGPKAQSLHSLAVPSEIKLITIAEPLDACALDPVTLTGVCIGYDTSKIYLVDVKKDSITGTIDSGVTSYASFSGGECIFCGALVDYKRGKAIFSAADGFKILDLKNTSAGLTTIAAEAAENFAYDVENNWIIAPSYVQYPPSIQIIDLNNNTVYKYSGNIPFSEPDAAAVDPVTKIAIITDEDSADFVAMNLKEAKFDSTAKTFTAPATQFQAQGYPPRMTGASIELTTHILFLNEEFGTGIGIMQLPTAAISGAPTLSGFKYGIIDQTLPDSSYWYNNGDPHGIAVFASIVDNKPFGFLLSDSKKYLAQIDLSAFLAKTETNPTSTPGLVDVSTGVVTFIDLTAPTP